MCLTLAAGTARIAPAAAAAERDLCAERPGLDTPSCVLDRGRLQVETGLVDWTLDRGAGDRTDTVQIGDTLIRYGLTDRVELQVGWTPYGWQRQRSGGRVDRARRTGDAMVGAKVSLANPDGSGLSAALRPAVTLPVGRSPIGAGDWGASLLLPLSYDLSDTLQVAATPEVDAAVDADGKGRHLAYGGAVGLNLQLTGALSMSFEALAIRDRDPARRATQAYGGLSIAYRASKDFQMDLGSNLGLNRASSDVELYAGVSRRF